MLTKVDVSEPELTRAVRKVSSYFEYLENRSEF